MGILFAFFSVNATTGEIISITLPIIIDSSNPNKFNITVDLSNIPSNYYKFKLTMKLTRKTTSARILQNNNNDTESTFADYVIPETYYVGTNGEIQLLINSNKNDENSSNKGTNDDKTTIIAFSVALSSLVIIIIIGVLIWKREKLFAKKPKNEPKIMKGSNINAASDEQFTNNEAQESIFFNFNCYLFIHF